jgi:DNA repair ATPase RecN
MRERIIGGNNMKKGITSTETFEKEIPIEKQDESKPELKPEFVRIPLDRYNNLKHVQKVFGTKFNEIGKLIKNIEKDLDEIKKLNETCKERTQKFMRF